MLNKIFSVYNERNHKIVCIFGIKIKFKRKVKIVNKIYSTVKNQIVDEIKMITSASRLHPKSFEKYKNCYHDKEIVLVATGPSLNYYEPIKDAIHVGVNRAFMYDKINLDYLFMQDYLAVKDYIEDSFKYKNKNLKRFYGLLQPELENGWIIPEDYAIKHNASRYYAFSSWDPKHSQQYIPFTYDIATLPLVCHGSIVFPALQFILYTNPKKIYLVGCDCAPIGHFDSKNSTVSDPNWGAAKKGWNLFKKFVEIYYPNIEIISINPVGLKDLFKDKYTKSYLTQENNKIKKEEN